jgi:hypothetical protein
MQTLNKGELPLKKPVLNTVIRLTNKEYVDAWATLIHTFYQEGISDDALFQNLGMNEEGESRLTLELSTALTVIALLSFASKPKLCSNEKQCDKMKDAIVKAVYRKVFPDFEEDVLKSCETYCQSRVTIFSQVCRNIYSTQPQKRQSDLVGFARYITAQVSPRSESDNTVALERLGILLSSACDAYMKLLNNSTQDTTQIDGKPSFSVKK